MDPATHILAAIAAAEIFTPAEFEPWTVAASVGAALAPDVDFLARRFSHISLLKFHHTITHSMFSCIFFAAAWAGLLTVLSSVPWPMLFMFAAAGATTHILLDIIIHNNGVMLFWPFSRSMVRGGWFLGLNPYTSSARCGERRLTVCLICQAHSLIFNRVFFILVSTSLISLFLWPFRRYTFSAGVILLALYVIYIIKQKKRVAILAGESLENVENLFPATFDGGKWLAVARYSGGLRTAIIDLKNMTVSESSEHQAASPSLVQICKALPSVEAFLDKAVVPFAEEAPDGNEMWWRDLSYDFSPDVHLHVLKIHFDDTGDIVSEEFRERW
jgi:hypothetical protein